MKCLSVDKETSPATLIMNKSDPWNHKIYIFKFWAYLLLVFQIKNTQKFICKKEVMNEINRLKNKLKENLSLQMKISILSLLLYTAAIKIIAHMKGNLFIQ